MIQNVVAVSKPLELSALKRTPEKLPIQQNELTLAPITPSHHGVVVITFA